MAQSEQIAYTEEPFDKQKPQGCTIVLPETPVQGPGVYHDTALPERGARTREEAEPVPDRILQMLRLYEFRSGTFADRCRNFYRQGKFMEDYEDNVPWNGTLLRYFPTYHNLNIRQLRGYFTWRTQVRKGVFTPIATSLAYLYLYELLNGIGTSSPEDALEQMRKFEVGFLDSGIGEEDMRDNLQRWRLAYAVLHQVPPALARQYASPALVERDEALAVLRSPSEYTDEEIFSALCSIAGKKLEQSPVAQQKAERGRRLFALVWRCASEQPLENGQDLFSACFGKSKSFPWHPLGNAVYWTEHMHPDADYTLDPCRSYHCRNGVWWEDRYDGLFFDRLRFRGLLHEADRALRRYLKTGHYLQCKTGEAWAEVYSQAVIEADRRAEREAARPQITWDFSRLDRIRREALSTRDSLLTEEEMDLAGEAQGEGGGMEEPPCLAEEDMRDKETPGAASPLASLDRTHRQILRALVLGENPEPLLQAGRLMPSVVADTINQALFDEFGDIVLECDGETISAVADYREEILQMLGGNSV